MKKKAYKIMEFSFRKNFNTFFSAVPTLGGNFSLRLLDYSHHTYPLYFSKTTFHFLLFLYSKWPQMSWMVVFKFNLNSFGKLKNKRKFLALPNKLKEGSVAIIVLSRFDVLFYFNFCGMCILIFRKQG